MQTHKKYGKQLVKLHFELFLFMIIITFVVQRLAILILKRIEGHYFKYI